MSPMHLLVVMLFAQLAAAPAPPPAALQGRVITVSGDAVRGATVELRALQGGPVGVFSATSDGDGAFSFRQVPPGRYQLTAMRGGYVRGDYGLRGPGGSGITLILGPGEALTDVRVAMRATATIAGRITTLLGEGIGNVHVKALRFSYQDGRRTLTSVKSVFTDDRGEYRLGWLPPGLYHVSALHPDAQVNPVNLPEVINSATIVGTAVTNPGGMNGGSFGARSNPDPAIRARLGLPAGEDYVPVYYPGSTDSNTAQIIEVRSGDEVGGVDMIVAPIRTASISGTIGPLPAAAAAGGGRPVLYLSRYPSYNLRSNAIPYQPQEGGAFSTSGLAPGSYLLAATSASASVQLTGSAIVRVSEGSAERVHIPLQPGVDIPVRVVTDTGAEASIAALRITLRRDPVVPGMADTAPARPHEGGSLVLEGVAQGDYLVNVAPLMRLPAPSITAPPAVPGAATTQTLFGSGTGAGVAAPSSPQRAYVKAIRVNGADSDGRVRIDGGPAPSLEIVVGTTAGHVDGVALDAARRPAAHAIVVLMPAAGSRHRLDRYSAGSTDAAGRFRFEHVPPGEYTVFVWEDVESWSWLEPQVMQGVEPFGVEARVTEGETTSVATRVIPTR